MKEKLIEALEKERDTFKSRGQSTKEHNVVLEWLRTGKTNECTRDFELLDAAMNDFKSLCSDYGITE